MFLIIERSNLYSLFWNYRSIAGGQTTPREGPSRESSRGREPRESSSKELEVAAPQSREISEDDMIKKTHAILDEYLHIQDIKVI